LVLTVVLIHLRTVLDAVGPQACVATGLLPMARRRGQRSHV
jgi:hypothetical protein